MTPFKDTCSVTTSTGGSTGGGFTGGWTTGGVRIVVPLILIVVMDHGFDILASPTLTGAGAPVAADRPAITALPRKSRLGIPTVAMAIAGRIGVAGRSGCPIAGLPGGAGGVAGDILRSNSGRMRSTEIGAAVGDLRLVTSRFLVTIIDEM